MTSPAPSGVAPPSRAAVSGAGLGLRRELLAPLAEREAGADVPAFLEVAPENWMRVGGPLGRRFRALTERYRFVTHGLSLSLGGPAPLDEAFVIEIKQFLDAHGIADYSEHLSWCSDDGHLYDLAPIPFTEAAVDYVAARIRRVQHLLERRIAIENVSTYARLGGTLSELDFIKAVIERADCDLLVDVNNIHVNAINHGFDALSFLRGLPLHRVRYAHIAGHYVEAEDLRVDTHGADVIEPVWALLRELYAQAGAVPTLLERDFNIPPLPQLMQEVARVQQLQAEVAHV